MIQITPHMRILLATRPADFRKGIDGLAALCRKQLQSDPFCGTLFVFFNRVRDRVKILFWDQDGFCIWYKRLEVGAFQMLTTTNDRDGVEIEYWQLVHLLDGLDLKTGRRRKRYRRVS